MSDDIDDTPMHLISENELRKIGYDIFGIRKTVAFFDASAFNRKCMNKGFDEIEEILIRVWNRKRDEI